MGTYPAAGAGTPVGQGEGIWRVELASDGSAVDAALAAVTPAPSFLARHPERPVLYAVNEMAPAGRLSAWAIGPGSTLRPLGTVSSGGGDPCHLLVHPAGRALYACNYASGTVATVLLEPAGGFDPMALERGEPTVVLGHHGTGPERARQEGPHAHFAAFAPSGRWVLVVDLGTDELRRYRVEPDGRLVADGIAARLPAGTGPRHLAFGPRGALYVVGELDVTVHTLRWDDTSGTASHVQVLPACGTGLRSGHRVLPAHLGLAGGRLYLSVRGADVIAVFEVSEDGALRPSAEVDSGGTWPRHFAVEVGRMIVANQTGGGLAALALGEPRSADGHAPAEHAQAGIPTVLGRLDLPSPACVIAEQSA